MIPFDKQVAMKALKDLESEGYWDILRTRNAQSLNQSVSNGYSLWVEAEDGDKFSVALGGATDGVTQNSSVVSFLSRNPSELFRFWVSRAGSSEKEFDLGEGDLKYFTNRVWPSVTAYFDKSKVEEIGITSVNKDFSSNAITSMAKFDRLHQLKRGVSTPYYENKKEVGKMNLPEDFFSLLSVPGIEVQIWYYANSSHGTGRNNAFELQIVGYDEVPCIDILYDMLSGVQKIFVHGCAWDDMNHECNVPAGFTLTALADILNEGTLQSFVLNNCVNLNQSQRRDIIEHGLY